MHAGKVCEENNGNNAVMEWGPQPRYIINGSSIKPITHTEPHMSLEPFSGLIFLSHTLPARKVYICICSCRKKWIWFAPCCSCILISLMFIKSTSTEKSFNDFSQFPSIHYSIKSPEKCQTNHTFCHFSEYLFLLIMRQPNSLSDNKMYLH